LNLLSSRRLLEPPDPDLIAYTVFMQDLRLAFRNLRRRPALAVVAVATLALGIGANVAVFTVTRAVILAPLPYHEPDDVVILNERTPDFPAISVTRYNYDDWRTRATTFDGIAAYRPTNVTVTGAGDPERLPAKMITATLLPLLGVSLEHGRNFSPAEDTPGGEPVAILAASYARRRFPDRDAVGEAIQIDGQPYTIVGVMPHQFELFQPADLYVPFGPWAATLPEDRGWHPGVVPVARVKKGETLDRARAEMDEIAQQLETEHPQSNRNVRVLVTRVQDLMVQNVRPAIVMLTGAVALVLLIACANVANLLLARAVDRRKEIAIRVALGASRLRIARELIVDSVVLASAGGIAGLLVAAWAVSLFGNATFTGLPRMQNIGVNWPVVLFAMGLSFLTGIVFGLVPAVDAMHVPLRASLDQEGRGGSGTARQRRTRSALVVIETGLALVLLVAAGLLLRSFTALTRVSPGFNSENLLVVNLPLSQQKYGDSVKSTSLVERLVTRARALPGVRGAAMTTTLPMSGTGPMIHFNRAAYPPKGPDDYVMASYRAVTPEYLTTLGVPLRRGRMLSDRDREGAPRVVVINESMARQFFPDRDSLGQSIQLGTEPDPGSPTIEVVGVVGDVKQSFDAGPKAEMFVPYAQYPDPVLRGMYLNTALVVRTAGNPADAIASVRSILREIEPGQPLVNPRTMDAAMAGTVAQPRVQMTLLVIFASIAVALAAVGVYGVTAYTVSQRIPEIGVRIAVGASPSQVIAMVVRQGAQLALAGIGVGLIAAVFASGALQTLLFEVQGLDPITFVVAPVVLAAAALLASYIPARRAARITPISALGR
jgi:putative ABC transport system permease protein